MKAKQTDHLATAFIVLFSRRTGEAGDGRLPDLSADYPRCRSVDRATVLVSTAICCKKNCCFFAVSIHKISKFFRRTRICLNYQLHSRAMRRRRRPHVGVAPAPLSSRVHVMLYTSYI